MKLITNSGKEYLVNWAAVSNIDGALRFEIRNETLESVFLVFTNHSETSKLIVQDEEERTTYNDYTRFLTIDALYNGNVTVALSQR